MKHAKHIARCRKTNTAETSHSIVLCPNDNASMFSYLISFAAFSILCISGCVSLAAYLNDDLSVRLLTGVSALFVAATSPSVIVLWPDKTMTVKNAKSLIYDRNFISLLHEFWPAIVITLTAIITISLGLTLLLTAF